MRYMRQKLPVRSHKYNSKGRWNHRHRGRHGALRGLRRLRIFLPSSPGCGYHCCRQCGTPSPLNDMVTWSATMWRHRYASHECTRLFCGFHLNFGCSGHCFRKGCMAVATKCITSPRCCMVALPSASLSTSPMSVPTPMFQ